jgi:hypothetical protein
MLVYWMDFSVEHMSRWWKAMKLLDGDPGNILDHVISLFATNVKDTMSFSTERQTELQQTIAMVAIAPYHGLNGSGTRLTAISLAMTILSMYHDGFGRVVIVDINTQENIPRIRDAFNIMVSFLGPISITRQTSPA